MPPAQCVRQPLTKNAWSPSMGEELMAKKTPGESTDLTSRIKFFFSGREYPPDHRANVKRENHNKKEG